MCSEISQMLQELSMDTITDLSGEDFVEVMNSMLEECFLSIARFWTVQDLRSLESAFPELKDRIDLAFKNLEHFRMDIMCYEFVRNEWTNPRIDMCDNMLRCGHQLKSVCLTVIHDYDDCSDCRYTLSLVEQYRPDF